MLADEVVIELDVNELWTVFKYLRLPREQGGTELDKDFMLDVISGIVELSRPDATVKEAPVRCSEESLWRITRLVDQYHMHGSGKTGFSTLLKVFDKIITLAEERVAWSESSVVKAAEKVLNQVETEEK